MDAAGAHRNLVGYPKHQPNRPNKRINAAVHALHEANGEGGEGNGGDINGEKSEELVRHGAPNLLGANVGVAQQAALRVRIGAAAGVERHICGLPQRLQQVAGNGLRRQQRLLT